MDGLVVLGLADRAPDPADGRAVRVVPTDEGTALMERARGRRVEVIAQAVHGMSTDQRQLLAEAAPLLAQVARGVRAAG